MQNITFLGLGAMGYHMAGHIAARDSFNVTVWNRSPAKGMAWEKEFNGQFKPDLKDAVIEADIILTCLGRDEDVATIILEKDGILSKLKKGSIVIDHTTTSYKLALELSAKLKLQGVEFIDAPVSGGEEGAKKGILSSMVGGDAETIDLVKEILGCYSKNISHIGSTGYGQLTKMVNQICIAGVLQGLSEGLQFAEAENIDIDKLLSAISGGAAQSWQMNNRAKTMHQRKFDFGFAIKWMIKDLGYVLERSNENGVNMSLTQSVYDHYSILANQGNESKDTSSLILYED